MTNNFNYYTIVQYLPNVVSGERINVGVIVYGGSEVRVHFLQRWQRVQNFSRKNIDFLKGIAADITAAANTMHIDLPGDPALTPPVIQNMVENWKNSIQFTDPRGGTMPVAELLAVAVSRYLVEPEHGNKPGRDRRSAAKLAASSIENALRSAYNLKPAIVNYLIHRDDEIKGRLKPQEFDVVAKNGKAYFAAQGISFEVADTKNLREHVNFMTLAINDVLQETDIPIGVIALPPIDTSNLLASELYRDAIEGFRSAGAKVASEGDIDAWAERTVRETIPSDIARSFDHQLTALPHAQYR